MGLQKQWLMRLYEEDIVKQPMNAFRVKGRIASRAFVANMTKQVKKKPKILLRNWDEAIDRIFGRRRRKLEDKDPKVDGIRTESEAGVLLHRSCGGFGYGSLCSP